MSNQKQSTRRQADRRAQADRRSASERRRGADNRNVVFEVCRSTVHLALVVRASNGEPDKVLVRSLPWRKESPSLHTDLGAQELEAGFRALVTEERLAGATVRVALSGELCVTRVLSGSTDEVRREFTELEERSHRYLTLGPGRKILASSVEQLDARHEHMLSTITNERTLDVLVRIADAVGIQIAAIEPSLVALCRAQACLNCESQEACLVSQLDDAGAELGICHAGRLLLDYRPGGHTNASNIADVLAQHLTRLQRYLNRHHNYLKTPIRQVYLAGNPTDVSRAREQFAAMPQFDVAVLDPHQLKIGWQFVGDPPGPEMAAVLGTSLLDGQSETERRGPNLMERILSESREPLRPMLLRSLWPIAATLVIAAGLFVLFQRERMAASAIRNELAELDPVRTRLRELQLNLAAADAKLTQLRRLEEQLSSSNWNRLLTRIAQSMPDDVWLDGLVFRDASKVSLSGASYADGGVYDFVAYLKQVPEIAEIALEGTGVGQSPTGPTTSFDLQLSLAEKAKSTGSGGPHD